MLVWIIYKSIRLIFPVFENFFIRSESSERFEPFGEVVCLQESCSVHVFDLAISLDIVVMRFTPKELCI